MAQFLRWAVAVLAFLLSRGFGSSQDLEILQPQQAAATLPFSGLPRALPSFAIAASSLLVQNRFKHK